MKSKDLQNIVLSKYQKDNTATEIDCHLSGRISLATIKRWCQMICQSATRDTCCSTDSEGTKENIQKVINCLHRKQGVSVRKFSRELDISVTSVRRVLTIDLGLKLYNRR